jgi:hypothetical protein
VPVPYYPGAFARCSDDTVEVKGECINGNVTEQLDYKWDSVSKSCFGNSTLGRAWQIPLATSSNAFQVVGFTSTLNP